MRHKANATGLDWVIDSAGTNSYHTGEAPHRYSQAICKANGIDISDQRARTFVASDFESYDKIYAMAEDVYLEIQRIGGRHADMRKVDFFLNELEPGANASVPDPWYGSEEGYKPVFEMIDKTCDKILNKYSNK